MKAYPTNYRNYDESIDHDCTGMDLRDYFAACAMQGFLTEDCDVILDSLAHSSYQIADAMMKAREK